MTDPTNTIPENTATPLNVATTPLSTPEPIVQNPAPLPPPGPTTGNVPMGDDTPLAFSPPPSMTSPNSQSIGTSIPMEAIPPAPIAPLQDAPQKKKSKMGIVIGGILLMVLAVGGGIYGYQKYDSMQALIAGIKSDEKDCPKGKHVNDFGECVTNDLKGGGEEKEKDKAIENANSESECNGTGGSWCSSVDANGKAYGFCGKTSSTKNCNTLASEKGYVIQQGIVKCVQGSDGKYHADLSVNYATAADRYAVEEQCYAQAMGSGAYICPVGTSVACTNLNGKVFNGNLGCFCGVVQVDTGTGHQSYKSSCGCDKQVDENPVNPTMACTSLTSTPSVATTVPTIGSKVTFTCLGSVTPSTAGTLSYKFRYSLNSGAVTALTNKTPTTAELTISACGSYKVECQACTTLNGVAKCDPVWTGATQ